MLREIINQALSDPLGSHGQIATEREQVEELMREKSSPPIYGFTTLLGHHDDIPAEADDQEALLDSHLVGPSQSFPSSWGKLLTRVKLAQLSNGGSGAHPDTYRRLELFLTFPDDEDWKGNWLHSYSCGDVVQGAWFAHNLRMRNVDVTSHRGDLISLINGNFVSTSAGLIIAHKFIQVSLSALSVVEGVSRGEKDGATQKSVTMRDTEPLRALLQSAHEDLLGALAHRLTRPSANPLFTFEGEVRAHSQSSFLEFTLSSALGKCAQTCAVIAAYLKGSIREIVREDSAASSARVQPVKIGEALLREISAVQPPLNFGLSESEGIEDVSDLSLIYVRSLARAVLLVEKMMEIVSGLGVPISNSRAAFLFPECVADATDIVPLMASG